MRARSPEVAVDVQRAAPAWRQIAGSAALVRKAARRAVAMGEVSILDGAEIAVSLADDARVLAANDAFRGKARATNVLSFPAVPAERIGRAPFLGDVILAYETVAAEAEAEAKPIADHMTHLVVHGVLHLIGYDHMTDGDAERMERLESAILASLGIADPYAAPAAPEADRR